MKIRTIIIILTLGIFAGCKNVNQKIEYPVVANIKLTKTLLAVTVVADSLRVPWDIQFLDDHQIIYTEIAGQISKLNLQTGERKLLYNVPDVYQKRTLGLLGMCLSPNMKENPYVFISYTTKTSEDVFSKLVRLTLENDTLVNPEVLHTIPGSTGHNGARLTFAKDGKLLWATGDAHSKTFAQDSTSLNGKILRMNIDGSVPADNPIPGSLVYAWGFRNMQGLTVSDKGVIYTSEHGDAIEDEVNLIKPQQNYGWPQIEGMHDLPEEIAIAKKHQRTEPIRSWTPVIAPSGLKYYNSATIPEWKNSLLLVTLKSQSLRQLKLSDDGQTITDELVFLEKQFGRIRAVTVSPSGDVYLATSNQDWNPQPGFPKPNDDRILKLSPVKKAVHKPFIGVKPTTEKGNVVDGLTLYNSYCESCHKPDGKGVANVFPPLAGAEQVIGEPKKLIDIVLGGLSGEITVKGNKYDQQMPTFNFLKDEELAKILTYVRSNFGNRSSEISATEISKQRK
ncbi:PQQ-dependent sugar dehydrogenase [Pedobacter arcticus]|uniref:PQQ-dependent sugar dehydrogenase n=1 Tax=Pedobacter arcticus TaxID=752140 RepID=UPI0002EC370E|nr:PQQ-dependent sugar dehydrogenase [Pedobacter arcticus]